MRAPYGRLEVTGSSMLPTLRPGDRLLVRWRSRRRPGELAIVALPDRPLSVKRLVGRVHGGYWVAGDNPAASTDSRQLGPLPAEALRGRVVWRYRPLVRRRQPGRRNDA